MNNDLEQFSEETLIFYRNILAIDFGGNSKIDIPQSSMLALVNIALSAKQAKPVAWEVKGILCHTKEEADFFIGEPEPLYDTPPINQYKPTFKDWLSSRTEKIEVDCGCVTTEAFYHWLKVAYEATPQPAHTEQVIPDGWKLVPIEPTADMHTAARDWSVKKYGMGVGIEGSDGCYRAMLAAAPKPESE